MSSKKKFLQKKAAQFKKECPRALYGNICFLIDRMAGAIRATGHAEVKVRLKADGAVVYEELC